jgi:cell division protein FtsW
MVRQQARVKLPVVKLPIDLWLFAATLALVTIGLILVLDSSYVKTLRSANLGYDAYYYVKRQAAGAFVGLFALFGMMHCGYWRLRRFAVAGMIVGVGLLLAVNLPHLGVNENGATRWVKLGPLVFQPSEAAKLLLILYIAALLSRPHFNVRYLGAQGLTPPLLVMGLYLALIEREPDLGTAIVLFLAVLTQMFLAGARRRHLGMILGAVTLAIVLMSFGFGHRKGRISTYLHPEQNLKGTGFQVNQARLAIGSGEWIGTGLGRGVGKYILPQANSDFIFATYAEETGLLGSCLLLGLMCFVGWRGFEIARRTRDRFGALLAAGIAALISWQALINIGVATGCIPATGVPLPFISNGSSSLVLLLAGIGLLLNIAQHPTPPGTSTELPRAGRRE